MPDYPKMDLVMTVNGAEIRTSVLSEAQALKVFDMAHAFAEQFRQRQLDVAKATIAARQAGREAP